MSAGFIINYIYNDFMFIHGEGLSAAYEPDPDHYLATPTPPTPAPTIAPPTPAPVVTPPPTPEPTPEPEPTPVPRVERQEFLSHRAHYNNDDIVGHLRVPNTTIDYLVTQGHDNDFYLGHDIRRRRSAPGWVFMCFLADIYNHNQNWVIYGHNMNRDHMFHSVRRFLNQDFFFNNRYIYFSTIYADYVFEVFSVYITHVRWMYIYPDFDHRDGGWPFYISEFARLSHFDAGIEVSEYDRVLTLSTCYNPRQDYRIAVHARLISETFPHLENEPDLSESTYFNGVRG